MSFRRETTPEATPDDIFVTPQNTNSGAAILTVIPDYLMVMMMMRQQSVTLELATTTEESRSPKRDSWLRSLQNLIFSIVSYIHQSLKKNPTETAIFPVFKWLPQKNLYENPLFFCGSKVVNVEHLWLRIGCLISIFMKCFFCAELD